MRSSLNLISSAFLQLLRSCFFFFFFFCNIALFVWALVRRWGTHLAHIFDNFKCLVRISWTLPNEMPSDAAIWEYVHSKSSATMAITMFLEDVDISGYILDNLPLLNTFTYKQWLLVGKVTVKSFKFLQNLLGWYIHRTKHLYVGPNFLPSWCVNEAYNKKQDDPQCPNSLTWVSLSLVYSKSVCLKFVENECFHMTGWRFKNCVIQVLGGMWWYLAQVKACWLVQYYGGVGVGGGGGGGECLTEARSNDALVFSFIFSSGGHLVQQSRTVWAILVEYHQRNILVKLLKNLSSSVRGEVF